MRTQDVVSELGSKIENLPHHLERAAPLIVQGKDAASIARELNVGKPTAHVYTAQFWRHLGLANTSRAEKLEAMTFVARLLRSGRRHGPSKRMSDKRPSRSAQIDQIRALLNQAMAMLERLTPNAETNIGVEH